MQIRGVTNKVVDDGGKSDESNLPPWKENSLVPEGWERMPWPERIAQLYVGRRGLLFWSGRLSYGAAIFLIGAWIVFRIVGPALGFYVLQGDVQTTLN